MRQFRAITLAATVLIAVQLGGCSPDSPVDVTPAVTYCIDGVLYYVMTYRMAVAFNPDSTVKTCGN